MKTTYCGEHGDGEKKVERIDIDVDVDVAKFDQSFIHSTTHRRRAVDGVLLELLCHIDGLDGGLALLHFFGGVRTVEEDSRRAR
jgi:hypothetical protein